VSVRLYVNLLRLIWKKSTFRVERNVANVQVLFEEFGVLQNGRVFTTSFLRPNGFIYFRQLVALANGRFFVST